MARTYSQMELKAIVWRNAKRMPNGCREWQRYRSPDGHGQTSTLPVRGTRGTMLAHRLAYVAFRGPVPEGKQLDHVVCDNPACCDPWHVEPSTLVANVMRGNSPHAANARKTCCDHGHEFDEGNTRIDRRGMRQCRTCARLRARRVRREQREGLRD
jgi:HNH endonuclease